MIKFRTPEELYKILNDTIEGRSNGTISEDLFSTTIDHLNTNTFGIFIDKSLLKTNKDDDLGYDSYEEDDSSYSY